MISDFPERDLLHSIDPAPTTVDDVARINNLRTVLERTHRLPRRRRMRLRVAISLGAAGALLASGAAAYGAIGLIPDLLPNGSTLAASGALTTAQLATWASVPQQLDADAPAARAAEEWCRTNATAAHTKTSYSNIEVRGDVVSMFYRTDEREYYCISSGGVNGHTAIIDPAPTDLGVTEVGIDTYDTSGDHGREFTNLVGYAGSSVTKIVVHAPEVGDVLAPVQNGRWIAWWPGIDTDTDFADIDVTATITTHDGGSHTVPLDSLIQR